MILLLFGAMPYKERTVEKLYWTIGEVAEELGVNTSSIRYWEKEFGSLRPKRTGKGDRLFARKDIDQIKRIMHLVKEEGFTLNGAKERIRKADEPAPELDVAELRDRLQRVRSQLLSLATTKDPS